MKQEELQGAEKYSKAHQRKRIWRRIVTVLAGAVVFCTVYALILPAVTMEKTECGIPEHVHTIDCYTRISSISKTALICDADMLKIHRHSQDCFDGEGSVICGYADFVVHSHNASCYAENGDLWCTLPEVEVHQHTDECFDEDHLLICGKKEVLLHEHTADCFDIDGTLICDETQVLAHQHTEACFEPVEEPVDAEVLTCSLPEDENHTHGSLCYGLWELTCGMEEHTHSEACLVEKEESGLTEEERARAEQVSASIESLPSSEEAGLMLESYAEKGNYAGQADFLADIQAKLEEIFSEYSKLTEDQKSFVSNIGKLQELEWLLEEQVIYPILTEDAAGITELIALKTEIIPADTELLSATGTIRNGETARYHFRVKTDTWFGDCFGKGRVKLEFVLPLPAEQAAFDLADMTWMDDEEGYSPVITIESRLIGEQTLSCQVLTCYKVLGQADSACPVIPGEAAEYVSVSVQGAACGEEITVQISAAMEHNTWDGVCDIHQIQEKLTVTADPLVVAAALSGEELQTIRDQFLAEVESLEQSDELEEKVHETAKSLLERLQEAHQTGRMSDECYAQLYERTFAVLYGDTNYIAEAAKGSGWILLRDSGWFSAYSSYAGSSFVTAATVAGSVLTLEDEAEVFSSQPSDVQITDKGGSNTADDGTVSVSKTASGTDLENVFDITLQVQTSENLTEICEEPDIAVVIVMDISNTMNSNFGGVTRYAAAMESAEAFLDSFAANSSGISKVGYVAFNTDAHMIFDLQPCADATQAATLKNTMRTQTGNIINASGYSSSHSRFTNVEAGLTMAWDMLSGASNQNKYIIFLSDGFPTTYIQSGYSGYDPYDSTGRFYDHVLNKPCLYGTSYSDEAAIRARRKAQQIKDAGAVIFSIGVDVAGQTIQTYITQSENANGFSVVDRTGTTYEIGEAVSTEAYKNWLRNSIGSGYYYDSTDAAGLMSAYEQIFAEIKHQAEIGFLADWVASDPLPTIGGFAETVEFIGFFDRNLKLASDDLMGEHEVGGENTATFNSETASISWDLKQSGYQTASSGGATIYTYTLRYRVRLKNEQGSFAEETAYDTNDRTTLQYRIIQEIDGEKTISDSRTVDFPIPAVKGYLAELTFHKTDSNGNPLPGAGFTLRHDEEHCSVCRGDGENAVAIADMTAISDAEGTVTFSKIPSGHKYVLLETTVPEGYLSNGDSWQVEVAYDELNVLVTAYDGTEKPWNGKIENREYYELPSTGGAGREWYTISGLLLTVGAALLLYGRFRRREKIDSSS